MNSTPVATGVEPAAVLAALPPEADAVCVRDGNTVVIAADPAEVVRASGRGALDRLDELDGWWAGALAYDLGRCVERVPSLAPDDIHLPDVLLGRFDVRLEIRPGGWEIVGHGRGRELLEAALARAKPRLGRGTSVTQWSSSLDRPAYEQAVRRVLAHIRAGDCYQVNLTRRLASDVGSDPVALYGALEQHNPAPHAAFVRLGGVAVVSASPERFLRRDGDRVETRPIKGTSSDAEALRRSPKDRAENVMIVDLARNDLGRVCRYGSVNVAELCALEAHPGLYHLVSTVRGTLRRGVRAGELIRATFPPASITGAPKPRVMEIIETLEPVRRGYYCGAIGFFDTEREIVDLNVAIRTFTSASRRTYFGVGGGIVADSDPGAEWQETELKARRLLAIAAGSAPE